MPRKTIESETHDSISHASIIKKIHIYIDVDASYNACMFHLINEVTSVS